MSRFVEGEDRRQPLLLPSCLDDYVAEDNAARVVDVFVEELDLWSLGFAGMAPAATGRPGYHPATLLKLYIYGYLNRVQSSRRLERESVRDVGMMRQHSHRGSLGCVGLSPKLDTKESRDLANLDGVGLFEWKREFGSSAANIDDAFA